MPRTTPKPKTLAQLAQKIGVSTATVSRAMIGRRGVAEETRRRVLKAAREARFEAKPIARKITVGLVVDQTGARLSSDVVPSLTATVAMGLARQNVAIESFGDGNLDTLLSRHLDVVIAIAWMPDTIARLKELQNVPVVIFNRPEYPEFTRIMLDYHRGGEMMAEHLWSMGHRRIGVLTNWRRIDKESYVAGIRDYVISHGGEMPSDYIAFTLQSSFHSPLQRLMETDITALAVIEDEFSYQVPYFCTEVLGIALPEALSVIGTDHGRALECARPPLTVVAQPLELMAKTAISTLFDIHASRDHTPRTIILEPTLIPRASVVSPSNQPRTRSRV